MSMNVTAHNIAAMNAERFFKTNAKSKSSSAEKLSSGYRINRAADDAAGLSISEGMRRAIRGLKQGSENAQYGVSWVKIRDGALGEGHEYPYYQFEGSVKQQSQRHMVLDGANDLTVTYQMKENRASQTAASLEQVL